MMRRKRILTASAATHRRRRLDGNDRGRGARHRRLGRRSERRRRTRPAALQRQDLDGRPGQHRGPGDRDPQRRHHRHRVRRLDPAAGQAAHQARRSQGPARAAGPDRRPPARDAGELSLLDAGRPAGPGQVAREGAGDVRGEGRRAGGWQVDLDGRWWLEPEPARQPDDLHVRRAQCGDAEESGVDHRRRRHGPAREPGGAGCARPDARARRASRSSAARSRAA